VFVDRKWREFPRASQMTSAEEELDTMRKCIRKDPALRKQAPERQGQKSLRVKLR